MSRGRPVQFPLLATSDWLKARCEEGVITITEMAKIIGCSTGAIHRTLKKFNIVYQRTAADIAVERHRKNRLQKFPQLEDENWLRQKHDVERLGLLKIAALLGCSTRPVRDALNRFKIEPHECGYRTEPPRKHGRTIPELEDEAWVRDNLVAKRRTLDEVSQELNCSTATVGRAARRFHLKKVYAGTRSRPMPPLAIPELMDESWLRGEYILKDRTSVSIGRELHCTKWAVQAALGRFRILKHADRLQGKRDESLPVGIIRKDGYLLVFSPQHPYANLAGYVPQHRLVVEQTIGRMVTPIEEVHHVNEKRDDNRPENLMLMANGKTHHLFHHNPPAWIPRCECCGRPCPERLSRRPEEVPIIWPDGYPKERKDDYAQGVREEVPGDDVELLAGMG